MPACRIASSCCASLILEVGSSPLVGSSSSSNVGSASITRMSATFCCCPPLRSSGCLSSDSSSSNSSTSSSSRSRLPAANSYFRWLPGTDSSRNSRSSSCALTVSRVKYNNGFWATYPMNWLLSAALLRSKDFPATTMFPRCGFHAPAI
ncbi:hypothetical protein D3C77_441760 [compost metagenome]